MIATIRRSAAALVFGAASVLAALSVSAAAAAEVKAVETDGLGRLTICRSWLLFTSCQSYNHITIPDRVAVGDQISVAFGSNPKKIGYRIVHITQTGDSCTLYNAAPPAPGKKVDRIVTPCRTATP